MRFWLVRFKDSWSRSDPSRAEPFLAHGPTPLWSACTGWAFFPLLSRAAPALFVCKLCPNLSTLPKFKRQLPAPGLLSRRNRRCISPKLISTALLCPLPNGRIAGSSTTLKATFRRKHNLHHWDKGTTLPFRLEPFGVRLPGTNQPLFCTAENSSQFTEYLKIT